MDQSLYSGAVIAVTTAIVTSVLSYLLQSRLLNHQAKKELQKERLTKLLLPLYVQLKKESVMFEAEMVFQNGDPAGFLDDLPKYYYPLEKVILEYLYLADDELTEKSLEFIRWVNVAKVDDRRFDKIMENRIKEIDQSLTAFKKCVFEKYENERKKLGY